MEKGGVALTDGEPFIGKGAFRHSRAKISNS